jgi:hypothetical protein
MSLRPADFERHILSLDIALLLKSLEEFLGSRSVVGGGEAKITMTEIAFCCARSERPNAGQRDGSRKRCNEIAPSHILSRWIYSISSPKRDAAACGPSVSDRFVDRDLLLCRPQGLLKRIHWHPTAAGNDPICKPIFASACEPEPKICLNTPTPTKSCGSSASRPRFAVAAGQGHYG